MYVHGNPANDALIARQMAEQAKIDAARGAPVSFSPIMRSGSSSRIVSMTQAEKDRSNAEIARFNAAVAASPWLNTVNKTEAARREYASLLKSGKSNAEAQAIMRQRGTWKNYGI